MVEACALCGDAFAISDGAHVTVNPPSGSITDYYVCPQCFADHVEPLADDTQT